MIKMNLLTIAKHCSLGQFSQIHQYLDNEISWQIIGENSYSGKTNVIEHMTKVENYFQNTKHHFELHEMIQANQFIIIQGQAVFESNHVQTIISACDVYQFNADSKIIKIQSYCIPLNKK